MLGVVTYRQDAVAALRAGQNAEIGDPNPYNGKSIALAKYWQRGLSDLAGNQDVGDAGHAAISFRARPGEMNAALAGAADEPWAKAAKNWIRD